MEPFVTRIGDVTIERVVPKSGPGAVGGNLGKEPKELLPPPSVSLAKRDIDGGDTISVSEDLQIFLKPPLSGTEKGSSGLKNDGRKSRDSSVGGSRDTSLGRGDDRMAISGTDESDLSDSDDNEDHHRIDSDNMNEEDEVLVPQSMDKVETSDMQQQKKNDEQSEIVGDSKMITSSIVDSNSQTALQNSIETGAVSLEPVRTEQSDGVVGGNSASDSKKAVEDGKGKDKEDVDRAAISLETNKRKASIDTGAMHKKKKTGISGKDESSSSSSDSDDSKDEPQANLMERKLTNMRRNIREVMSENQLDEETLAAQRQEMERLRRVQEQQRIIREVQRQIALNRQNNKTQTRVISLLQGNSSLLKQIPSTSSSGSGGSTQVRLPNTVLVKLASGSGQGSGGGGQANKKVFELLRVQKGGSGAVPRPGARSPALSRTVLTKPRGVGPQVHMMTPSVSIAPVLSSPRAPMPSESESEGEEDSEREMMARAAALRKVAGKGKGKNLVTVSSSSDDDDCILLSEPSSGDEGEPVDDPTNSGMHTNDLYNTPDEQGRVLVNVGRPAEEPEVFLAPQIARIIKPHQIGGVRFLFDNVVESLTRFNTSTGFGCILAHSMGLGKTLQVISFCDVFLRHTNARTVLCIMPINTLQNWLAEFNMWLPAASAVNGGMNSSSNTVGSNSSSSSSDNMSSSQDLQHSTPTDSLNDISVDVNNMEIRPRNFALHVLNDSHKTMAARSRVIKEWAKGGGVLLIGYELYRQLSLKRPNKTNSKKRRRKLHDDIIDVDEDDKNKALLDEMHAALVKPGPDLVICDEGHRIKNSHASISQALKQIRSKRRVVLTGYPLQNNLLEYWCMVDFVRPNYLGTKTEFCNMFERPIQNGQCIDSTPQDIRLMRYRAHVLHSLLEGFVQRRSHSVLQVSLPQKEEYVLLMRMTSFQRKLYDTFMNEVVRTKAVPNPLKAFAVCCKIWNHPDVLYYFLKKRNSGEDVDLDLEEATAVTNTPLVPGAVGGTVASPRGTVAKRGRGSRGPRNPPGQNKREKKGSALFRQMNKPAATITPQTANLPSDGTSANISNSTNTNKPQCNTLPEMVGGAAMQQDTHGNSQSFNMMGQQNQPFTNSGSYPDMQQHFNPNNPPPYSYPSNTQNSSYDPNYPNNYNSGNPSYESGNHNTAAPQFGGPGNYYSSGTGPPNGQQGNYDNNSMGSFYPPGPGNNQQGNSYQNSEAGSTGNASYWQQHGNQGYYQHTGGNENSNQYYDGNGGGSYSSTNTGESGDSSYYMGHHQQGQFNEYGNRDQGNMYHGMNSAGYMGEIARNSTAMEGMATNSQNPSNTMNMQQNSSMNSGAVGNMQNSQNPSTNNIPNPMSNQQNSQQNSVTNQNMMGNTQNPMSTMQTASMQNYMGKNQSPQNVVGTPQNPVVMPDSPVGNQQNQSVQSQNSIGNQSPMLTQQNSQNVMGSQQNSMNMPQNPMGNSQNSLSVSQNQMSNTHNSVGTSQNPMGVPQNMMSAQNLVGPSQNLIGNPQNSLRNPQNPMGTPQNPIGPPHNSVSQNALGSLQNQMGMQQNSMGPAHNLMGVPQNTMAPPQNPVGGSHNPQNPLEMPNQVGGPSNPVGTPQSPLGTGQNLMGSSQNPMVTPQNKLGAVQNPVGTPPNTLGAVQNPVGTPQNSIGIPQNSLGMGQNQIGTPANSMGMLQNQMGNHSNPTGTSQNSMCGPQNQIGIPQNPVGVPQNQARTPQTPIGVSQNQIGTPQTPIGVSQSPVGTPQNPVGIPQNSMGTPQNPMGGTHNHVGTQQNTMGVPQNQIGTPQNPSGVGLPQNQLGMPQAPMAVPQNQIGPPQNPMGVPQNQIGPPHSQMGIQQNQIGPPQNPVAVQQNQIGPPQTPTGMQQNQNGTLSKPMGIPQNAISNQQNITGTPQNLLGTTQSLIGPPQNPVSSQNTYCNSQNPPGSSHNQIGTQQNLVQGPQNLVGISQNATVMPQNSMGMSQTSMGTSQNPIGLPQNSQNPVGMPQHPLNSQQNVMGMPQNGSPQNSITTPQNPLGSQQNMLGISQNTLAGAQDSAANQSMTGCSQTSVNGMQNNSQNSLNAMQTALNQIHGHPETTNTSTSGMGNSMQDAYNRMSTADPKLAQNMYSGESNVNSYHHQMNRSSLQRDSSSGASGTNDFKMCGNSGNNFYGQIQGNPPYLGDNMNRCDSASQNTLMNVDGNSGNNPTSSEMGLYGPQSGSMSYPNRWDNSTGDSIFPSSQRQEENKGTCESAKEESEQKLPDGNAVNINKNKLNFGNEGKCHEQKINSNTSFNIESCEQKSSDVNRRFSSDNESVKCLDEMKTSESGVKKDQDEKNNTLSTSCSTQHTLNPSPGMKTEDKITSNCSNETQTDIQTIATNMFGSLGAKSENCTSDMSTQHNAFKMEPGSFKTENHSHIGTVKAFERASSSPQFLDKEMKNIDLNKDMKPSDKYEAATIESKDASCGTPNFDYPKDLNLNEGKQVVELGPGAARNIAVKEDPGIPYDWATELLKNYIPGSIENSAKMEVLFCILEESMALGDRMLVFSQSLFTLNLIEDFLQKTNLPGRQEKWARNWNYYRLDGSTSALEREKLINEYNSNPNIHLFLVSTRAGSLGINLVGANRVVVFDASWNPCHDTQAVCRVYRYGQKKPCFVYRLVMDNCLEKKIYDRQINKQGMADRVVDECNPDAHLSIKEVTNLCWDNEQDTEPRDFSAEKDKYIDVVMQKVLDRFSSRLSKVPFQHESLLVDRKEKKLSQAEKRLAKRSYELEKQANINYSHRPQYSYYPGGTGAVGNAGMQGTGLQIRAIRTDGAGGVMPKPVASVRPMQAELSQQLERGQANRSTVTTLNTGGRSRWIPAEVWQRQGMSAQEMTLPLDVVIPTNSPDRASIVLKAGQRVMVLKSPKGIYMQLENGKIIAIRTAFKVGGAGKGAVAQHQECKPPPEKADLSTSDYKKESTMPTINRSPNTAAKISNVLPFKNNSAITIIPKNTAPQQRGTAKPVGRMGSNSSGGGIVRQDVTVKPWGPRIGSTGCDVSSIPIGGNKNVTSQQPMAQARPYFHRSSSNSNTDMGTAKPYFHHDSSSDHLGMMGHHTSDEGSSGAENMVSTPCGEDKDVMDGGLLKSPSSDDFNQDNSMSSHEFGSIRDSNRSSYDSHINEDMMHDSGTGVNMSYGNQPDQRTQDNSYGRQDQRSSYRRQMEQGSGNVSHQYGRQTHQRVQDSSVSMNRGYGRQMDQGIHDSSSVSHGYGRFHNQPVDINRGYGRHVDNDIQEMGRQTHEGMSYSQHGQSGVYSEHKEGNFGRSDLTTGVRYCPTESESGSDRNFHGTYEDTWQQGQGFRGLSRMSDGGGMSDNRNYQQPFKSGPHGAEKHSLTDSSSREQQRANFTDYSHRQHHQEPQSPTFRSEASESTASDSGIEILPLPTPSFPTPSKESHPQQSTNLSTSPVKTSSLKNYRHSSFNAQLNSREIEIHPASNSNSENVPTPVKPVSGDHYMKSPQHPTYHIADIKSPTGFQQSHEDFKSSNQAISVSSFSHSNSAGNLARENSSGGVNNSSFLGTNNPNVSQHTLLNSKSRQKNPINIGRFGSDISISTNYGGVTITPTTSTKSKRGSSRSNSSEQQHYEFDSGDSVSDANRINPQQQSPGKAAGRSQLYPVQQYHTPSATPAPKKGRGTKNASSDRSNYASVGSNAESGMHHGESASSSKNQPQQQQPSQNTQSISASTFSSDQLSSQYPASEDGSNKPLDPYSNPVYGHQQYYPASGYYGGFGGPQQPAVGFGGTSYYSGENQYAPGRMEQPNKSGQEIQKGSQTQTGMPQQQQQTQQQEQPTSQPTTTVKTQQIPSGMNSQKKDQANPHGNSTEPASKAAGTVTNPSTPTAASPSSTSGGSRSGNNSARSTPATVANSNISQEPSSPQLHFNTSSSANSTTVEARSPVPYNANPASFDPKSPLQYNNTSSSSSNNNNNAVGGNSSSPATSSLQYNSDATSPNFSTSTANTPQSGILPPPHQSAYESVMLGGYSPGATGAGYAPPPPPPPGMGYGSYSNPSNQYETDYARASMYSAFHRPDPHPHPFAPGHPPGFLPPPQGANYYPQNMYPPTPYGTPDPSYYSNPFLNAMHQHPYPTLPGTTQNPGPQPQ